MEMVKQMKKIKINDHRSRNITIAVAIIVVVLIIVLFVMHFIVDYQISQKVMTVSNNEDLLADKEIEWFTEDSSGNSIDINEIIHKNVEETKREELETEIVELEYETEYQNNSSLPKGMVKVLQQGQDGEQELIIRKQYIGEELVSDEQVGRKITKACINKIVQVGTAAYYDSYTIKVGDTVYSTPYSLALRKEANKKADIIITVSQDSEFKVIKKDKTWYYVQYGSYYGWVEADCVTYINPNKVTYHNNNVQYTKKQLVAKLSTSMNVMQPSGFTLEQFKKVLSNNKQDTNGVFADNAEYFYYVEQQYGINGIFVAAIGIHESAWGTSKIAVNKKNLFGYGAYDMNAYSSAYSYNGYAAGIDMIARVLVKHYLNPAGTSIYNGEIATGKYYCGTTIKAVNTHYASDKNWSNGVYSWMKYLYNKL